MLFRSQSTSVYFGADLTAARNAAMAAAERAVMLDPNDAEGHAVLGDSLGYRGEFTRAMAECDIALRLSPRSFEIPVFYAGWASAFGQPARGAEKADQAIRLNPDIPKWATGTFSYAYFMASRYQDALRILDREAQENYHTWSWAMRAGSYAALGHADEAHATVKQALDRFPDLTIEGFVSDPGMSEAERQRLMETMRAAGFPPCAKPEELARFANPVHLPECAKS